MSDPIERQAAIDAVHKDYDTILDFKSDGATVASSIEDILLELPSAQPERKKGEWILKPNIYGVAYCSECDYELHTDNTNFCPNCGADMRGEEDER